MNSLFRLRAGFLFVFFLFTLHITAQETPEWWELADTVLEARNREATPGGQLLRADLPRLRALLSGQDSGAVRLSLPGPQGAPEWFVLHLVPTMEPGLQERYPSLRTYRGVALADPSRKLRFDLSSGAWHAMIDDGQGRYYIDPLRGEDPGLYLLHRTDPEAGSTQRCLVDDHYPRVQARSRIEESGKISGRIRQYRLAVSASAGYTAFFGGTKEGALEGIVTTINRVNLILERDLGVRLILVANNDTLIVTDPLDDPFTEAGREGQRNQEFIDERIGPENYDIGHVFGRGTGGYAWPESACGAGIKAQAFSGLDNPEGDGFDIDFVAHEFGHQLGGNHTYNGLGGSCASARYPLTAFEPGSGTTIMAYAGICGGDNVAPQSNDYFHGGSIAEIYSFLITTPDQTCTQFIPTGTDLPELQTVADGTYLPILTPFELEGGLTDTVSGPVEYLWEQVDAGGAARLGNYGAGDAAIFRSYPPDSTGIRVFPRLENLLLNRSVPSELLPNKSRNLNFQFTVKNETGAGPAVSWVRRSYEVTDRAGPFRAANIAGMIAGSYHRVVWDPAGTDLAPVNCKEVDILLSVDGGYDFSLPLLLRTPNDGEAVVRIPDSLDTTLGRIKIKASDNIFFDVCDENFPIRLANSQSPALGILYDLPTDFFCGADTIEVELFVNAQGTVLEDSIRLEVNATGLPLSTLRLVPVAGSRNVKVLILPEENVGSGNFSLEVVARTPSLADSTVIPVRIVKETSFPASRLIDPALDAKEVPFRPVFRWASNPFADAYRLEVAETGDFSVLVYQSEILADTSFAFPLNLQEDREYFWRVVNINRECMIERYSSVQSFSTQNIVCEVFTPDELPVAFNNLPFIQSSIELEESRTVVDVNVLNVSGNYSQPGGLSFRLRSPEGPILDLVLRSDSCDSDTLFAFSLDDEASGRMGACPDNGGRILQPETPLSTFNGQDARGKWTLSIFDNGGEGQLDNWNLEICYGAAAPVTSTALPFMPPDLEVAVFPNPFRDEVVFRSAEPLSGVLSIFDLSGRLRYGTRLKEQREVAVMTNDWPSGIYFYVLQTQDGKTYRGKLVRSQ